MADIASQDSPPAMGVFWGVHSRTGVPEKRPSAVRTPFIFDPPATRVAQGKVVRAARAMKAALGVPEEEPTAPTAHELAVAGREAKVAKKHLREVSAANGVKESKKHDTDFPL